MRALIIDAENQEVREAELDPGSTLRGMQAAVGGLIAQAHCFDGTHELYVNDEGLLVEHPHWFQILGAHQPFAGNGIVVGIDEDGETIAATMTLLELRGRIFFSGQCAPRSHPEPVFRFIPFD